MTILVNEVLQPKRLELPRDKAKFRTNMVAEPRPQGLPYTYIYKVGFRNQSANLVNENCHLERGSATKAAGKLRRNKVAEPR